MRSWRNTTLNWRDGFSASAFHFPFNNLFSFVRINNCIAKEEICHFYFTYVRVEAILKRL